MKVGIIWRKFKIFPLVLNSKNFLNFQEKETAKLREKKRRGRMFLKLIDLNVYIASMELMAHLQEDNTFILIFGGLYY